MSTRFARVVIAQQHFHEDLCEEIPARKVVTLLQREHAACMAWRSKKLAQSTKEQPRSDFGKGYRTALADLLAWLDERGR